MKPSTKKALSAVAKAVYKQKKVQVRAVNKKEQELTPKNGFFKSLFEAWLAIEKRLRNG